MILFYFLRFVRKQTKYLGLFLIIACSYFEKGIPTRIENEYPPPVFLDEKSLPDSAVLLDARTYFEYATSHLDEAYHQDYKIYLGQDSLWPPKDLSLLAGSLSRKGIGPDTPVLVLGNGVKGEGQECRVAWSLYYMGIPNVSFIRDDFLKGKRTMEQVSLPEKRHSFWQAKKREELILTWDDLIVALEEKQSLQILDVRQEEVFLNQNYAWDPEADAKVVNIPWQELLIDRSSFPDEKKINRLIRTGWDKKTATYVFDQNGLGGACAAMALMAEGFENVKYYAGSYLDLEKKWQK